MIEITDGSRKPLIFLTSANWQLFNEFEGRPNISALQTRYDRQFTFWILIDLIACSTRLTAPNLVRWKGILYRRAEQKRSCRVSSCLRRTRVKLPTRICVKSRSAGVDIPHCCAIHRSCDKSDDHARCPLRIGKFANCC